MIRPLFRNSARVVRSGRQVLSAVLGGLLIMTPPLLGVTAPAVRPAASHAGIRLAASQDGGSRGALARDARGLFSVRSTGVATRPALVAADAFLATLTPEQRSRLAFPSDEADWLDRMNTQSGSRPGLSLAAMTGPQRDAAIRLLQASLDADGLRPLEAMIRLRRVLGDQLAHLEPNEAIDHFTLMGNPSVHGPWGWQLDGRELVVNYLVAADQVVMTPTFIGQTPPMIIAGRP